MQEKGKDHRSALGDLVETDLENSDRQKPTKLR